MPLNKNLKTKFIPKNPGKYVGDVRKIVYRSSWERLCMEWMDSNPGILKWNSEDVVIQYIDAADGRQHRYYVDFWIKTLGKDGIEKEALIEVKPEHETIPPTKGNKKNERFIMECRTYLKNVSKWAAAKAFAEKRGMAFYIVTEKTLKLDKYAPKKRR